MLCYFPFPTCGPVYNQSHVSYLYLYNNLDIWVNKKDILFINILTVNSCLKGTIISVNEYFIKWVCNKKLNQLEYIQKKIIRKIEGHNNKVTKCNKNQSK